ncbi:MAG: thymidine phosphorylase [Armatimonadota bacterium]
MRIYDIIRKKRDGETLTTGEIDFLVDGYVRGDVPDSQMAAWLMTVFFSGLNARETADLTLAMVRSGQTLDLSAIPGTKVDKHSTGGVGDKTTLVLIPLLAAAGVPMIKMAGRSLGYTGGTIDKLESIPGFRTDLSTEQMIDQVNRIGAAITGQTADLVPADKKLYALRDLTAAVESIPLIASSVMSKKIAAGADAFVLDVKAGSGAFMTNIEDARKLARAMVDIGNEVGRRTVAVITDMEQPLGRAVGNALEVKEAIETLKGEGPDDLVELCVELGGIALVLGGKAASREEGRDIIHRHLSDGTGADKLRELIQAQDGDPRVVDDASLLPTAPIVHTVTAVETGYVHRLDALRVAQAEASLGGSRGEAGAKPDLSVGVYLLKKYGDHVSSGEPLAQIHAEDEESAHEAESIIRTAYEFGDNIPARRPLIYEIIER